MPIYEYEPTDWNCLMCDGRIAVLQGPDEEPLDYCPGCGMPVQRVISAVSIRIAKDISPDKAAKHGLTTFRRSQKGIWEKVAGPGVDVIASSKEDFEAVENEKQNKVVVDLDDSD